MNSRGRLAGDDRLGSGSGGNLQEMSVAIHQAGRRVDEVDQAGRLVAEMERGQQADGDLLITVAQARAAVGMNEREPRAADLAGRCEASARSRNSGGITKSSAAIRFADGPTS